MGVGGGWGGGGVGEGGGSVGEGRGGVAEGWMAAKPPRPTRVSDRDVKPVWRPPEGYKLGKAQASPSTVWTPCGRKETIRAGAGRGWALQGNMMDFSTNTLGSSMQLYVSMGLANVYTAS